MRVSLLKPLVLSLMAFLTSSEALSQVDDGELGGWYMYFWDAPFVENSRWGMQGDLQWRNWSAAPGSDLEQLLIRGGITYSPKNGGVKFTLGYASITTGEFGDSDETFHENRIYQEALIPQKILGWVYLTHRFRYEQRFVDNQDTRTRYRYNLFVNIPLNKAQIVKGTWYLAFYNELFINGQRDIGNLKEVELFDRNRVYGALGYQFANTMKVQAGLMRQITDNWAKYQLQLSLHHSF